jgi:hypothetical protein
MVVVTGEGRGIRIGRLVIKTQMVYLGIPILPFRMELITRFIC